MIKRLTALLAGLILALTATLSVAAPAHAVPTGYIYLWDWVNFNSNGGRLVLWKDTIKQSNDGGVSGCLNLHDWYFGNGLAVTNRTTSFAANNIGNQGELVQFFDYINCNPAGGGASFNANTNREDNDLSCSLWACLDFNNHLTSIRIVAGGPPPGP